MATFVQVGDLPIGIWKNVEDIYSPEEAEELRTRQMKEMQSDTTKAAVLNAMSAGQEVQQQGLALIVLGPSAAGKSALLRHAEEHGVVTKPERALDIDGEILRDCSSVWQEVIASAHEKGLDGFSNYFVDYAKPAFDVLKDTIITEAMESKTNLVIPETASDFKRLRQMVENLTAHGYNVQVVAVVASKASCEDRGKMRERADGKRYSSKSFQKSLQSIVNIGAFLPAGESVIVFENEGQSIEPLQMEAFCDKFILTLSQGVDL